MRVLEIPITRNLTVRTPHDIHRRENLAFDKPLLRFPTRQLPADTGQVVEILVEEAHVDAADAVISEVWDDQLDRFPDMFHAALVPRVEPVPLVASGVEEDLDVLRVGEGLPDELVRGGFCGGS